jgi:two component transcriptional regulator, winged helix family
MNILIVEDEINLAMALKEIMDKQRYQTTIAFDGEDGYLYASNGDYDLIILDGMLPKMDGFEIIKKLRALKIKTPVIMLTARDGIKDKIEGLDSGADDYMTKPFVPEELLARVRALSRRKGEVVLNELVYEDIMLNLSLSELSCGEKTIGLSYTELEMLRVLMSNIGIVISKDALLTKVWGNDTEADYNNVEAYVSFLRKKLDFIGSKLSIKTLRKLGYKLELKE